MAKHVLLEYATRRHFLESPVLPNGATYDHRLGCWMIAGKPLVKHEAYGMTNTKKCDQETGEDQKGE